MFRKGDAVTYLSSLDNKGTVRFAQLFVHSCGKKQMILCSEDGEVFQGCLFRPQTEQGSYSKVLPRVFNAEAEALALEYGAEVVEAERARMLGCIEHYRGSNPDENDGYVKAIRKQIAELHEPRAFRRDNLRAAA